MADIRIIKHEAVPKCGSFEVRFSDGRPSQYFYWKDLPGRRLRRDLLTSRQGRLLELSAIGDGEQGLAPAGEPLGGQGDTRPTHPSNSATTSCAIDKPVSAILLSESCTRVSQTHHAEDHAVNTVAMLVPVVMRPRGLVSVGV